MLKNKQSIALIASAISLAVILGVFLLPNGQSDHSRISDMDNSVDLGLTYVPVSPESCACYDLEVNSGALITEVIPGSPMDMASVKPGDVIISYNGIELNKDITLLSLIKGCSDNEEIVLEICRGDYCYSVTCCNDCGSAYCECDHRQGANAD